MKKIIVLFSVFAVLVSCQNETSQAENEYNETLKEVFDYHDEAMPKMGEIADLIAKLEVQIASDSNSNPPEEELVMAKERLEQAHDHMMAWMKDFSENYPDVHKARDFNNEQWAEENERLQPEISSAKEMRDDVFESVAKAKKVLGEK